MLRITLRSRFGTHVGSRTSSLSDHGRICRVCLHVYHGARIAAFADLFQSSSFGGHFPRRRISTQGVCSAPGDHFKQQYTDGPHQLVFKRNLFAGERGDREGTMNMRRGCNCDEDNSR